MTKNQTMRKLGNAIRARRGVVSYIRGKKFFPYRDQAPRHDQAAIERIERWGLRARLKKCL